MDSRRRRAGAARAYETRAIDPRMLRESMQRRTHEDTISADHRL